MIRLAWLGVACCAWGSVIATASAQDELPAEVEIITEPPPQPEPPPGEELPAEESPAPESAPPVDTPETKPTPKALPKKKLGQLRVGAGIGFGFGSDVISVGLAPQVSYIFKRIVEPGVSLRYQYTNDRFVEPNAIWHTFGASLFVRLYPIRPLFLLVEGELINTGFKQGGVSFGRQNYGNLFLGGGYLQGVGRGAFIAVSIKVNVFRNPFYPRNIPIFGVGAGFGF